MKKRVLSPVVTTPAAVFTQDDLVWRPWLEPLEEAELTPTHREAFKSAAHAKSSYFRLLAHDVPILKARSKSDQDIFYTVKNGLPRAEREFSAVAVSRCNGCIYCASVHARFASVYSKRKDDVNAFLDKGFKADLGPRWNAIASAAAALAKTPSAFDETHVAALREAGLADLEIMDLVNCAAFFSWANRLMLSLGEPDHPAQ